VVTCIGGEFYGTPQDALEDGVRWDSSRSVFGRAGARSRRERQGFPLGIRGAERSDGELPMILDGAQRAAVENSGGSCGARVSANRQNLAHALS